MLSSKNDKQCTGKNRTRFKKDDEISGRDRLDYRTLLVVGAHVIYQAAERAFGRRPEDGGIELGQKGKADREYAGMVRLSYRDFD